jgi:hypothetical protein
MDTLMHARVFFSKSKKVPCYSAEWSDAAQGIEAQLTRLNCEITVDKLKPFQRERRVKVKHVLSGKTSVACASTVTLALCQASIQLSYKVALQSPSPYELKRITSF